MFCVVFKSATVSSMFFPSSFQYWQYDTPPAEGSIDNNETRDATQWCSLPLKQWVPINTYSSVLCPWFLFSSILPLPPFLGKKRRNQKWMEEWSDTCKTASMVSHLPSSSLSSHLFVALKGRSEEAAEGGLLICTQSGVNQRCQSERVQEVKAKKSENARTSETQVLDHIDNWKDVMKVRNTVLCSQQSLMVRRLSGRSVLGVPFNFVGSSVSDLYHLLSGSKSPATTLIQPV